MISSVNIFLHESVYLLFVLFHNSDFFNFIFYISIPEFLHPIVIYSTATEDRTVIKKKVKSITDHSLTFIKILEIN